MVIDFIYLWHTAKAIMVRWVDAIPHLSYSSGLPFALFKRDHKEKSYQKGEGLKPSVPGVDQSCRTKLDSSDSRIPRTKAPGSESLVDHISSDFTAVSPSNYL